MSDRKDATRACILAAAERLMTDQGIRSTTVEQVAKVAHVSVGAIYTHFAGKPGLALHFIAAGLDDLEVWMNEARLQASPGDRVAAAGEAYLRFAVEHPVAARFCAVRVLDRDPAPEFAAANAVCGRRVETISAGVAEDVAAAMQAGQFPARPLGEALTYLWALWNGAALLVLRQDRFVVPAEAGTRALKFGSAMLGAGADGAAAEPSASG